MSYGSSPGTSIGRSKSTSKSIAQIGAELEVGTVLEGSVRKAGNRLRITLQLIDVATQEHIWSNSYNRDLDDVFAVQAEVAEYGDGPEDRAATRRGSPSGTPQAVSGGFSPI